MFRIPLLLAGFFVLAGCLALPETTSQPGNSPTGISTPTELRPARSPSATKTEILPAYPAVPTTREPESTPTPTYDAAAYTLPPPPTPTGLPTQQPPLPSFIPLLPSGQPVKITTIDMIDVYNGWAIGGDQDPGDRVLSTQDGGQTWREVTPPLILEEGESRPELIGAFLSKDLAWIITSSMILPTTNLYHTTDGGQTWEVYPLKDPQYLTGVFQFVDSDHGWIMVDLNCGVGSCFFKLYRTRDSGLTWEKVVDFDNYGDIELMGHGKSGLLFVDEKYGWLTRDFRTPGTYPITIEWTEDGGDVWFLQPIPAPPGMPEPFTNTGEILCGLDDPILFKEQHGLFAVHCIDFSTSPGEFYDFLYISSDGLRSYQIYPYPGGKLQFINSNMGWSLGREIHRTRNGGRDWESMGRVFWDGQFDFVTQQTGFAVARSEGRIALVRTFDGGRTWQLLEPLVVTYKIE